MIKIETSGSFKRTNRFFDKIQNAFNSGVFDKYGRAGVQALESATPIDSGETASSWYYEVEREAGRVTVRWLNRNVNNGVNIALILQYGHATRNGGFVQGRDYINPALRSVFDGLSDAAWKEVTSS